MSRVTAIAFVACLVLAAVGGAALAATPAVATESAAGAAPSQSSADEQPSDPRIVALYPNPVTHMDAGEFVEVWLPPDTGELLLREDRTTVRLSANISGRVVVTNAPNETRVEGDPHMVAAAGLSLADEGDRVRLLTPDGRTHHSASYQGAPEGDRWVTATAEWRPLGYDPREPRRYDGVDATTFTLPDSPQVPRSTLRSADERILVAGYTLTSDVVVRALLDAHERGVTVRVLLEQSPIGGMTRQQATALDRLSAAGVDVRVLGGPRSRFAYHHAKYAVVDDRALVLTENWKPAGTGGRGSRGWGVTVSDPRVATGLATLFREDAGGVDATPWSEFRRGRSFATAGTADGEYPSEIDPESHHLERVRLLTTPGNAEREMVAAIDDAESSVAVVQASIQRDSALVRACIRAAARGVEVRILLSSAWYAVEENRKQVAALNEHAEQREVPLSARTSRPGGKYEKIHAKGLVVDGQTAYVGSLNWNSQAAAQNREVMLELHGATAGEYFLAAFETDWQRSGDRLPLGVAIAVLAAVGLAAVVARKRIRFGEGASLEK